MKSAPIGLRAPAGLRTYRRSLLAPTNPASHRYQRQCLGGCSFLITAAGQFWFRTRFPLPAAFTGYQNPSLVTQGNHRIDSRGATCWQVRGECRYCYKDRDHGGKGGDIECANFVKQ